MSNNNIFLIGYMGSGKTTMGKYLAKELKMGFVDLDLLIEQGEGESITEIFSKIGEKEFRILEREYLKNIIKNKNTIISLGGGTPCYLDNMKLIKSSGYTVYLKVPAFILQQRLEKEVENRPMLFGMNPPEMLEFIQQHIGEREQYYLQSDMIYAGDNLSELVSLIPYSNDINC